MKTRRVVEGPLGDEVVQDAGFVGAQPVVGIGAQDPVLGWVYGVRGAVGGVGTAVTVPPERSSRCSGCSWPP